MMKLSLRISVMSLLIGSFSLGSNAQTIGISNNGVAPNVNAMLDINVGSLAVKKGMLIPRMTAAQRLSIGGTSRWALGFSN